LKVVVQNGTEFSRKDLETIIPLLPLSWLEFVRSFVLYESRASELRFTYHQKEQHLGIHWPSLSTQSLSKPQADEELLVAIAILAKKGVFPAKVSKALRASARSEIVELREQIVHARGKNDA
jgi:hypothetical protein